MTELETTVDVGQNAPDFTFPTIQGETISLYDFNSEEGQASTFAFYLPR
jgi:peroxiredoxin